MPQKQVAVAMSGGMDSSVAAALLKSQGYQVIGVTMQLLSDYGDKSAEQAKQIVKSLGIPHHVTDFSELFSRKVITPFCTEYGRGRTPNPCIACNQYIKFGLLLNKVRQMGADYLATGHYARVEPCPSGYRLLKAIDHSKDQSYFLYTLGQEQLRYLLLPMGNLYKSQARRMARELGLANTATRYESQDICFIPDNNYRSFIAEHIPSQPGDIIDTDGKILGKHKGLAHYTVGQRQGLGLASDKRLYVLKLDAKSNRLVVGSHDQLSSNKLVASQLNWISGKAPEDSSDITAKVRYKSPETAASLHLNNGTAEVRFSQPQWAIAPGQAIVFYQGEAVSGGGIIEASELTQGGERDKKSPYAVLL